MKNKMKGTIPGVKSHLFMAFCANFVSHGDYYEKIGIRRTEFSPMGAFLFFLHFPEKRGKLILPNKNLIFYFCHELHLCFYFAGRLQKGQFTGLNMNKV